MNGLRIKELRKQKKLTQKQLADKINVDCSAVTKWETGKANPDFEKQQFLADFFGVSVDYLLGRTVPAEPYSKPKGVRVPVLGNVAAGIPIEAIEDIVDYEEISEEMASRGEFFGLKIKGSSMEPRIKEGDVVIVRQQPEVESGDVAIILVNGDSATCKKVVINDNGITLIPFNPTYEPKFYSAEQVESLPVRIIGKVVELRGKF